MGRGPEENPSLPAASSLRPALVVEVLDQFLDWCERTNAKRTYEFNREKIQQFVSRIPRDLAVEDLRLFHVTRALADFPDWGEQHEARLRLGRKGGVHLAETEELIERKPLAQIKKPAREAREMAVSPEEYARVIETVKEPRFRDLIEMMWETGSRVQELRQIEAC
jgi:hypothetical protein